MKKVKSIVITTILLISVFMQCFLSAYAVEAEVVRIENGETVYGTPAEGVDERYVLTSLGTGDLVIKLETDGGVYIAVTNSENKEIAPSEYSEDTEYGSHISKGIGGYSLSYGNSNSTKVAKGTFVYKVQEGDYFITISSIMGGADAIKMKATAPITATPTSSKIVVNGEEVKFDAYRIGGNNYFKLRDIAMAINGTEKEFEVTWSSSLKTINLISGASYTPVGGEMASGNSAKRNAQVNSASIYLDDNEVFLSAYTINDNNYFKLRDIGKAFDFDVSWDGKNNTIIIDTTTWYTED